MANIELKVERLRRNLKQKDVANILGITEASYSRKENGLRSFTGDEIKRLALALDLDVMRVNEIFFDNKLTVCNM
ncbi:MAG: helix-turn-helix transcriptional regulator [Peptostreptococcaceae bacterium]|nr:helix-turn-helix transcriptional regulator [Peptostreptococcaceae bacterium]